MRKNRVLEKLRKGQAVCLASPTPYYSPKLIEMIGLIGFDGVWIDMEHQDYSFDQLFNMCLACRATNMDAIARIRKSSYWAYFRCMEAGATGIMVPHVTSAQEVGTILRNSRYYPLGLRGMDGVEALASYGLEPMKDYMASANQESLISIQVEDREAIEAIDEIAAVDGLDGIMIGPSDLAQSYGIPTERGHPQIEEAISRVSEACARHAKWWGIPVASPELAKDYYEMGARFFICGAAIILLSQSYTKIWKEFASIFRSSQDAAAPKLEKRTV